MEVIDRHEPISCNSTFGNFVRILEKRENKTLSYASYFDASLIFS